MARADTFFVSKSGSGTECTQASPCATISQALATERATSGLGDRIEVGPGLFEEKVAITDEDDAGLTLKGAGRGADESSTPSDATTIRAPEDKPVAAVEVTAGAGVSVTGLRVEVPAGFEGTNGLYLDGERASAGDVQVESGGGIALDVGPGGEGSLVQNARVRQTGEQRGLAIFAPHATVVDSDVRTAKGQTLDTEGSTAGARVLRTRLETGGSMVASIRSGDLVIDSSLLIGAKSVGLEAYAPLGATNLVTLSNDTIDDGQPKADDKAEVAVEARAESTGTAAVSLVNTIALEEQKVAGEGSAAVTCKTSIVPNQTAHPSAGLIECGPESGNLVAPASAVFAPGADWHLIPGSPAVDSGSGGDAFSSGDLDGNPRLADGNGDGIAVIDRGAYELPPPTAPPVAQPSNSFSFGKLKRNKRKGIAKLEVNVPGPGSIVLSGKKVKNATLTAGHAGTFRLGVVPKRKPAQMLRAKGSAKISVVVAFTPTGGTPNTRARTVKLIRRVESG